MCALARSTIDTIPVPDMWTTLQTLALLLQDGYIIVRGTSIIFAICNCASRRCNGDSSRSSGGMWLRSRQHAWQRGSECAVMGLDLALYNVFITAFCAEADHSNLCMTSTRIRGHSRRH